MFGHSIMRSFLEAYKVLSQVLLDKGGYELGQGGDKSLLADCLKQGQEMLLRKKIASEAAISEPLFATAAKLADYRELLTGSPSRLTSDRERFAAEVNAAVQAIDNLQRYHDQQQELACDS